MNKKLIALAVLGAVIAPEAMAQSANPVTLYGQAWVMFNNVRATGGATQATSRNTVVDESSRIGVRGVEDLGGGLKGIFQIESSAPPDAGGGTLGSRNSGVGLQGAFGTVMLGKWDSPMKLAAISVDPTGQNTIANQLSVVNTGDFNRRENNTVQYWSPTINGFAARIMYGANEGKAAGSNNPANPSLLSYSLGYSQGPFNVIYAYDKHKDYRGATVTAGVTERADLVAGSVVFGPVKLGLLGQKIKSTDRTDKKASYASAMYTMGKNEFFVVAGRVKNGAVSTAALQPDSKLLGAGYNYNFSKRTSLTARYGSLRNNAAASLALSTSSLPAPVADNDAKGMGVGIKHTF
jgi:predicted porin